jgi:hypothetical protein
MAAFSQTYAAQNLEDFDRFQAAIGSGRLETADEA